VKVEVSVDVHEVRDELNRLLLAPDIKTILAFNEIFAAITAEVAAIIHVETGSLKTTPKWDSPTYPGGWQGTLHVGGAAPGAIRDPAYYGVYELARGGSHFFFAPAYAEVPGKMVNAILGFFSNSNKEMLEAAAPSLSGTAGVALKSAEKDATHRAKMKTESLERRAKKKLTKEFTDKGKPDASGFYLGK
jgi:hypothetical protein